MLLIWTRGRTLLNPSWFFITQHTTDFAPSEHPGLSSFAHTNTSAAWDAPVSHPFSLARSPLSWPFSTSPRRRSQTAQSTLNRSRCWCEGHWVKPCASMGRLSLPVTMGMSPDTWSNEDSSPSLCHPLPPASSVQMAGRMTDLWYDCPTFVLTAPPHLAKIVMKFMWEQPCCPSSGLGQPCGKLPGPDLAKTCLEIPSAVGCFDQRCGVSCPWSLWELHLSHHRDPPVQGRHKQAEGLPADSKALEIWG